MLALVMVVLLQTPAQDVAASRTECPAASVAAMREAAVDRERLDTDGALRRLDQAGRLGCHDAETAATFLRGLTAARRAYASGGSVGDLEPVRRIAGALEQEGSRGGRLAALAHALLMAAAAAAQSEREDMSTWFEQAEAIGRSVQGDAARVIDVPLVVGDLWLQVHRFDAAAAAYRTAARSAPTLASTIGLARVARRLDDRPAACTAYGDVVRLAEGVAAAAAVLTEASTFVAQSGCQLR